MPLQPNPDAHREWQRRSRENARAKPGRAPNSTLAARGAKAKRQQSALDAAYAEVDKRDGGCQFHLLQPGHKCVRGAALHHDHLWGRNVRPELREAAWAIVLLCSFAHVAVTEDSELHRELRAVVLARRAAEGVEEAAAWAD